eukprot:m51a1_g11163 hypothetical protein (82) ;mRNA; r:288317-288973
MAVAFDGSGRIVCDDAEGSVGGSTCTGVVDEVAVPATVLSAEEVLRLAGERVAPATRPLSADTSGNSHALTTSTAGANSPP